jgi:hypothetical protein
MRFSRLTAVLAAFVALGGFAPAVGAAHPGHPHAPARHGPAPHKMVRAHHGSHIPQGGGGDADPDNSGAPSDGDGNV